MSIVKIAQESSLQEGERLIIDLGDERICIISQAHSYQAFSAYCTHIGTELVSGTLEEDCIVCPLHGSRFNIYNGEPVIGPAKQALKIYPVSLQEGWLCLDIPEDNVENELLHIQHVHS